MILMYHLIFKIDIISFKYWTDTNIYRLKFLISKKCRVNTILSDIKMTFREDFLRKVEKSKKF
jgi:hypothetical protein